MTFGEKLKVFRKNAGFTQEQLAEKLCVSRQAITKWEADGGVPDISNLQNISKLFGVSIDSLLESNDDRSTTVIKEKIDISQYHKTGNCRSKYDAVVKEKYFNAKTIYPLIRRKKMNKMEAIIDFIVQPGVLEMADSFKDMSAYYLVEATNKQLLVKVTKTFIEGKELNRPFEGRKYVIDDNVFVKATYVL
ncbi:MAG: helix-turn-helix domain-containing protein [Bacillaceae bacterium]